MRNRVKCFGIKAFWWGSHIPLSFMNNSDYNLECKWRWMISRDSISFNVPSGWVFVILRLLHVITDNLACCYWKCNVHEFPAKYLSNFISPIQLSVCRFGIFSGRADNQTPFLIFCWSWWSITESVSSLDCLNVSGGAAIIPSDRQMLWMPLFHLVLLTIVQF